jgi:hypothetical protein
MYSSVYTPQFMDYLREGIVNLYEDVQPSVVYLLNSRKIVLRLPGECVPDLTETVVEEDEPAWRRLYLWCGEPEPHDLESLLECLPEEQTEEGDDVQPPTAEQTSHRVSRIDCFDTRVYLVLEDQKTVRLFHAYPDYIVPDDLEDLEYLIEDCSLTCKPIVHGYVPMLEWTLTHGRERFTISNGHIEKLLDYLSDRYPYPEY